ncbi:MAG: tetratricopeptide repeat protein [Gammaproteobacteria bacterium]
MNLRTKATRLDPRYALAYAQLSRAWAQIAAEFPGGSAAQQAYGRARSAANTALRLDPDLAAAYDALGFVLLNADLDWNGALIEARRAAKLAPNAGTESFLGQALAALGQLRQAVSSSRQRLVIDPLSVGEYESLSRYLAALGRLDGAEAAIRKAIELAPGASRLHVSLMTIAIRRGDAAAARAAARHEPSAGGWRNIAMALALQIGPDREAANTALRKLIDEEAGDSAYQVAEVYALRHDPDAMFKWLDRAWANRDPGIRHLLSDPFILRYKNDQRFLAFCNKVGLPTTTDAVAMK